MNRRQIVSMWCGIAVFVIVGLRVAGDGIYLWRNDSLMLPGFIVVWICVGVVTVGPIKAFEDRDEVEV